MEIPTNIHGIGNALEAIIWWTMGGVMLVAAFVGPKSRVRLFLVAITFVLFGCSDVVEITTGAWWRPWWLLCWKASCVLLLVWFWFAHHRESTQNTEMGKPSDDRT